ncbi:MAG: tRNA-dihydrouridine synthase [Oscillospiraceae bacterium]
MVPQLLTNRAEHFLWAAGELYARGYREINFNLGCPAGTVAAKRKGSGLLAYPQELDHCLRRSSPDCLGACPCPSRPALGKMTRPSGRACWRSIAVSLSELIVHPEFRRSFTRASPTGTPGLPYPAPGRRCITATSSRRRTPPPCAGISPERTR